MNDNPGAFAVSGKYLFRFYSSIRAVEDTWSSNAPSDEYWQVQYHLALESSLPEGLKPVYVTVWHKDDCLGLLYFQHKKIDLSSAVRNADPASGMRQVLQKLMLKKLNMQTLVLGNMLLTGKYGIHFKHEVALQERFSVAQQAIDALCIQLKKDGVKIGPVLLKDFQKDHRCPNECLDNYTEFCVQPNMVFELKGEWKTMEDYVEALKSKARIRYRRAKNMMEDIKLKNLEVEDLESLQDEMYAQYRNIAENAGFNLFYLKPDYFINLKKFLGSRMRIMGYFNSDGKLYGFFTVLKNYDHLDAHFLGYDVKANRDHQIYLNMLFEMTSEGISLGVRNLNMSRTAVEIKSSVGARATPVYCYLKHRNKIYNKLVPHVVSTLYKDKEWQERSPFK
ncbi:MAG: hypothetical protein IPN29_10425 [Saprospiraceae bacterium]|nr:hypothetical protein [Saprospiraceae bacterium]